MIHYTICFIRSGDRLLLVNREFPPNQGLWNGVGGKIKPGENPLDSVIREVAEETGIHLATARFAGLVTWSERHDQVLGGMYAFLAELPEAEPAGPVVTPEGILAWKELDWVLDPNNRGVVSNIQRYLPVMLRDPVPYEHRCLYRDGLLKVVIRHPLPGEGDLAGLIDGRE